MSGGEIGGPEMLKVLHFVAGNLYGGVEAYLATVAKLGSLVPEVRHEFAVCYQGRLFEELNSHQAFVHELGSVRISRPWTVWKARSVLERIVGSRGIDVVVTHGSWPHLVAGNAARRAGARLVYFTHDNLARVSWGDRIAARVAPDLILANSQFTLDAACRLFPNCPALVCYLPVESFDIPQDGRNTVRRDFKVSNDCTVIIQVSRLERWKGHVTLLEALGRISNVKNWEAWIVGGAQRPREIEYFQELQALAARLGIAQRIRFLGQRNDVRRILAAADVFCQANLQPEPFGIAFVEALYSGLPVVTSDFGGGKEIVGETCGILTPPGDTDALAETLCHLIQSTDERRRIAAKGPTRAWELCDPRAHFRSFCRAISHIPPYAA
ncbi:MAG: glycosyltransferase family 4 protein [Planctomycetales bacterium]|nr:glycosyltransferase family 4 protein [Planctomycetales bacterium]